VLDVGLVGSKSTFWKIVEARFNEGFSLKGAEGIRLQKREEHLTVVFLPKTIEQDKIS